MAIISSYPTITPTSSDLVLIVDTSEDGNPTKTATVGSVNALATAPSIATATFTVTNAQLLTLGTVPVEILPAVTGYIYEILGVVTNQVNSGGVGDSYTWLGDGVLYGQGFVSTQHRLAIPNNQLPSGGLINAQVFVGTPSAGTFRKGASLKLSTTTGVNPTLVGTPNANWAIDITYRLIKAS